MYSMPWLRCSFANALFFQHVYPHLCWTAIVVWQLYVSRFKRTGAPITGDPQNRSQSVFPPNLEILRSRSESVLSPIAMCSWGQTAQWGQNITMTWSLLWLSQRPLLFFLRLKESLETKDVHSSFETQIELLLVGFYNCLCIVDYFKMKY